MKLSPAVREHVAHRFYQCLNPEYVAAINSPTIPQKERETLLAFVRRRFKLIMQASMAELSPETRTAYVPVGRKNWVEATPDLLVRHSWLAVRKESNGALQLEEGLIKLVGRMPAELVQSLHAVLAEDKLVAMVEWEELNGKKGKAKQGGGGAA